MMPTSRTTDELRKHVVVSLGRCGVTMPTGGQTSLTARTPITGEPLLPVATTDPQDVARSITAAHQAFLAWRTTPAPVRGRLVQRFAQLLRERAPDLAQLIAIEVGKVASEARGEVQEMIDICDLAVGLSRQIGGSTLPSERPGHRLMETWHPLGVVAVISAFNFPAAVWAWNAAIALVCGDAVVWRPSELTPLTALACSRLLEVAAEDCEAPPGLHQLVLTDRNGASPLLDSPLVRLVSATGSERMGAEVARRVAARFGRLLLELGGNNAAIVCPSADLALTTRAVTFAAAGTAGQRCTTLRRLIAHHSIIEELIEPLVDAFATLRIGDPLDPATLVGPLIHPNAYEQFRRAIAEAEEQGGKLIVGGERISGFGEDAYYVRPAIMRMPAQTPVMQRETFAPLLYVCDFGTLDEAIRLNNDVPQGLASAIFTRDQQEAERFLAADGSDCGIVNVNIGTSGAEIGGAFGGEKSSGGGRESGSDAWKAYMRRATNTINYCDDLPLAQGVTFT